MRHHVAGRKLGRTSAHRKSMLANLASSLAIHGRIETTLPKAKELRSIADRLVTLGKRGTLAARRRALALIRDRKAVQKAFAELAVRFHDRNGGYTRILKLGYRHGDSAPMAMIEYLKSERHEHAEGEQHEEGKKAQAKKVAAGRKAATKVSEKKTSLSKTGVERSAKPAKRAAPKGGAAPKAAPKAKKSGRGD